MENQLLKFTHPYEGIEKLEAKHIEGLIAFNSALAQLLTYIQKETEFKPEKRFIDALRLLDMIGNTMPEIKKLLLAAQSDAFLDLANIFGSAAVGRC